MLPEVETYIMTVRTAERECITAVDQLGYYGNEYYDKRDALRETRDVAINDAWEALKSSDDALVRFVAEKAQDYRSHAEEVLQLLPCSADFLRSHATDRNWCSTWDEFVEDAIDAGVIEGEKVQPERRALQRYLRKELSISQMHIDNIAKLTDAVIVAETKN